LLEPVRRGNAENPAAPKTAGCNKLEASPREYRKVVLTLELEMNSHASLTLLA
jgi:hypothetical protein